MHILPFGPSEKILRVTAPYHRKAGNMSHAIDFAMPIGTPIVASCDGTVTNRESRYNTNHEHPRHAWKTNYVTIRHEDGTEMLYAHLAWRSVVPRIGKRVNQGQLIGLSGETGYATYPHLHIALYDAKGKNIPILFCEELPAKIKHKMAVCA